MEASNLAHALQPIQVTLETRGFLHIKMELH